MNQKEYDATFGLARQRSGEGVAQRLKRAAKTCSPWSLARRRVPVSSWMPRYSWRDSFPADLIAGITLGIYNIPQGMAYSVLASLPPVFGLYASFFPPLVYFLFGSSRHVSIGVFSITCLMVGHTRTTILPDLANGTTATEYEGITDLTPVDVVVALSMVTGILQLWMALLRLDFLTAYLSDAVISGFNLGAACHAIIAQCPSILGVRLPKRDGLFKLFLQCYDLFTTVPHANLTVVIVSLVSITAIVFSKLVLERRCRIGKIPFPTELIVMVVGILVSHSLSLHSAHGVKTIDHVPTGMPPLRLPVFALFPYLIKDALSIAVISYAVTVSMGKLFARQHGYSVDNNQELCALGLVNCCSSFFSVFPTSTSLSRTLVNEGTGAKTQVSGFVSSGIILLVILWIGPLLEALPMCILSSIVVVALRSLFMKVTELPRLWSYSRVDMFIWLATALATICTDLIEGLAVGIVAALLTVVWRSQWPSTHRLAACLDNDYRDVERYGGASEKGEGVDGPMVLRFDAPLVFTNIDRFKEAVVKECAGQMQSEKKSVFPLIIDCSTWTYTDAMGVDAIRHLHQELSAHNIVLMFANSKSSVRVQWARAGLLTALNDEQFYPTIAEAVKAARLLSRCNDMAFRAVDKEVKEDGNMNDIKLASVKVHP